MYEESQGWIRRFMVLLHRPREAWNVGNVENIVHCLFSDASSFNQPLQELDVGKIEDMMYWIFGSTS